MKQNKRIAVTGGIGSGKSTVCEIIKKHGYPVFSCDEIYAELLECNDFTQIISDEFGKDVLNADGLLNRGALSEIVFNDEKKLERLNKITHAQIFEEMFRRAEIEEGAVFFEVPLLFEGGYQTMFDNVIVVLRDEKQRILSLIKRDNLSEENVKKRIKRQYNYENCTFEQYYVIHNDGDLVNLDKEVKQILSKLHCWGV